MTAAPALWPQSCSTCGRPLVWVQLVDHFDAHVRPAVRCVYSGSIRLWPVTELQRWLDNNATGAS